MGDFGWGIGLIQHGHFKEQSRNDSYRRAFFGFLIRIRSTIENPKSKI